MTTVHDKNLSILLYFLYGLPDVRREEKYKKLYNFLKNNYDPDELISFSDTIDDTLNDNDFDFRSIDKNLPHSTEDIVFFLKSLKKILAGPDKFPDSGIVKE